MDYDPVPDAIEWLAGRTPLQRHEIARLMDVDGAALLIFAWIVDQPDCDRATAAMLFWRVRGLEPRPGDRFDPADRRQLLAGIAARAYPTAQIAWDGNEAWDRTPLIGAPALDGLDEAAPSALCGPFGTQEPELPGHAFLECDPSDQDIFDSLWRHPPSHAAIADALIGQPAEQWIATADALSGGHPEDLVAWMVQQPECAEIADELEAPHAATNPFIDPGLWFAIAQYGYALPRTFAEFPEARRQWIADWERRQADDRAREAERNAPPGLLERIFYGGKFTGTQAQMDRAWRGLILVTLGGMALVIALWRGGAPVAAGFWAFLGVVAVVSIWLSTAKIGHGRQWRYWPGVALTSFAGAFLFRWIDTGAV